MTRRRTLVQAQRFTPIKGIATVRASCYWWLDVGGQESSAPAAIGFMKERRLPIGIKDLTKTELPALVALDAIGQPWFSEAHRSDLRAIGLVAQLLAPRGSRIQTAAGALAILLDSDLLNLEELRPVVVEINRWFQVQPNGRIQAAIDSLLGR